MNLVITGSRDWPESVPDMVSLILDRAFWGIDEEEPYHVYVGDARGVDRIVRDKLAWLDGSGIPAQLHVFKADWNKWGKAAGPIRNANMLGDVDMEGGGLVVAFHSSLLAFQNEKSGTNHCARLAERLDFTVYDIVRNPRPDK